MSDEKPKRDWSKMNDRVDGRDAFVAEIQKPERAEVRKNCIADPKEARRRFAEFGGFELAEDVGTASAAIPADVDVRCYEQNDLASRMKLVTLVLPSPGSHPEKIDQVWRCTYSPYRAQ